MNSVESSSEFNRREFLKGGSFATLMTLMGGVELVSRPVARAADLETLIPFTINCAVIGLGSWGREIISTMARVKTAKLSAICDTYPASVRRASGSAPGAKGVEDYRKILEDKEIQAVFVATPTHQHREIVLAALQAGKHVYCEAPLAHTIEDARTIAKAAQAAKGQVFQAGLQGRCDPQRHFLLDFVRAGAYGKPIKARAQWHKKQSWRFTSPNPDREKEINWRLDENLSLGLAGEIGIHQADAVNWFFNAVPSAVTGFGSIVNWRDGRKVADSIQAVFEYPGGPLLSYEATLANSFDADYEMYYGTDAAIMIRGSKAWMFKEVDSPLLGWEVYARKDTFYKETGIVLIANATKLANLQEKATDEAPAVNTPLQYAVETFLNNVNTISGAVQDFADTYDVSDKAHLEKYLGEQKLELAAGPAEGFAATVMAVKAAEAVARRERVAIDKSLFELS